MAQLFLSSAPLRASSLTSRVAMKQTARIAPRFAPLQAPAGHKSCSRCACRIVRADRSRGLQIAAAAAPVTPVKILIQGRKMPVTDSIRGYVEDKVQNAVAHFTGNVKKVDVTLSARGGDTGTRGPRQQKVDVTVHTLRNGVVRVEDSENDLYASIDLVCDKLERKLRKLKERSIMKGSWPGKAGPHVDVEGQAFKEYLEQVVWDTVVFTEEERTLNTLNTLGKEYPEQIVRSKSLSLEPISVADAIDQLEQLGHDFYVFCEKETHSIQVLYKRKAEGYGLLIPRDGTAKA